MCKNYDSFISVPSDYSSVVKIKDDEDNADFWRKYVINDNMVEIVRVLGKTLHWSDKNDVHHIMIGGQYGSGKTYSAIVIKHLLEDEYETVENYLGGYPAFVEVRENFLAARKKGKYFVKYRIGECAELNTASRFLLQLEFSIREVLTQNGFKNVVGNSLLESIKNRANSFRSLIEDLFNADAYQEFSSYTSFEDILKKVNEGDFNACNLVANILLDNNVGVATNIDSFKSWLIDIYKENEELSRTGIFIIWDEFTDYIRFKNDLDIIQQLSLLSSELPFYIIYVVHEFPGLYTAEMNKAEARFNRVPILLSEKTTTQLIGENIVPIKGMESEWDNIRDKLYDSLDKNLLFNSGDALAFNSNDVKAIFPIHPMTVSLVTLVAGSSASERSIFKFLEGNEESGFIDFIKNNGFNSGWRWVTPDYLWDYFCMNDSAGLVERTSSFNASISHYKKNMDLINDNNIRRVFKVAMLLNSCVGTGERIKRSSRGNTIQLTSQTLYNCFSGAMSIEDINIALQALSDSNMLALSPIRNGNEFRFDIPYYGTRVEVDETIKKLKHDEPLSSLFDTITNKESEYGTQIKDNFLSNDKAVLKRLKLETCWCDKIKIASSFNVIKSEIETSVFQFGMLVIANSSSTEYDETVSYVKELISEAKQDRILVTILQYPYNDVEINSYYEIRARELISRKSGINDGKAKKERTEAVSKWTAAAVAKKMTLLYFGNSNPIICNSCSETISIFSQIVLRKFPTAPESFFFKNTLYKSASDAYAYYGLNRITKKEAANPKTKGFDNRWSDCVDILKDNVENVWKCKSVDEIIVMSKTPVGKGMSALCNAINSYMNSENGQVLLDEMWAYLSGELGYYNCAICCYLIGFAFKFYVGEYTWYDGTNSYLMNEDNIPGMIAKMIKGQHGMKISKETDETRDFKEITCTIFNLRETDIGDIDMCLKSVRTSISDMGYPFWLIKYLGVDEYKELKAEIIEIADNYTNFIRNIGNQEEIIFRVVDLYGKNAKYYKDIFPSLYANKYALKLAMKNFIVSIAPDVDDICIKYNFSNDTLYETLRSLRQEEVYDWSEESIQKSVGNLKCDLELVGLVNSLSGEHAESVKKAIYILSKTFDSLCVPQVIYNESKYPWVESVDVLYNIANRGIWAGTTEENKRALLEKFSPYIQDLACNLRSPVDILKEYITAKNIGEFTRDEYIEILSNLNQGNFNQSEDRFRNSLTGVIEKLIYNKDTKTLLEDWKDKTNSQDPNTWMIENEMSVYWVYPECSDIFDVLIRVSKGIRVDSNELKEALFYVLDGDFGDFQDKQRIEYAFISNVSSGKYFEILRPYISDIKNEIKKSLNDDYSKWHSHVAEIRRIVDKYISSSADINKNVKECARKKIQTMSEDKLRKVFEKATYSNLDFCLTIINDDD